MHFIDQCNAFHQPTQCISLKHFSIWGDLLYLLQNLGLMDTYTSTLCSMALENMGNYYDLHEYLMQEGAFCPVGFKSSAVYVMRGHASGLKPAPYNVFYGLSDLTLMSGGSQ